VTQNGGTTTIGGDIFAQSNTDVTGSSAAGLLSATNNVTLTTVGEGLNLDGAVFTATLPLITALNSTVTMGADVVTMKTGSTLTTNNLTDAMVLLNASKMIVGGFLVNMDPASSATINGHLVSLLNGSTLTVNGGALVLAGGTGTFTF
jgi:hypothetical protein